MALGGEPAGRETGGNSVIQPARQQITHPAGMSQYYNIWFMGTIAGTKSSSLGSYPSTSSATAHSSGHPRCRRYRTTPTQQILARRIRSDRHFSLPQSRGSNVCGSPSVPGVSVLLPSRSCILAPNFARTARAAIDLLVSLDLGQEGAIHRRRAHS